MAINGFGRIGRCFLRALRARTDAGLEVVAINDLMPAENLAYLLNYDSVYGRFPAEVSLKSGVLVVGGKEIPMYAEKELSKLPWREQKVDIVIESTGVFTDAAKAMEHLNAGAKRVVITAPAKGAKVSGVGSSVETILVGANDEKFNTAGPITSNASCTTNAASPLIGILDEAIGIERALLSTTHAYTVSQSLVDGGKAKDLRESRAAAQNIVPSSTGAAKATALAYPSLTGKFDGISLRVPVPCGSIVDITFVAKRATSAEEVNQILKTAAAADRWKKVFAVSEEPLVSSDIIGQPYGAIADLQMTRVVGLPAPDGGQAGGTLVKVLAWYDNEMGYAHTLVEHVLKVAKTLK